MLSGQQLKRENLAVSLIANEVKNLIASDTSVLFVVYEKISHFHFYNGILNQNLLASPRFSQMLWKFHAFFLFLAYYSIVGTS